MLISKIIEWVSTIVTLIGASLVSLDMEPYDIYVLNLGSFLWMLWGFLEKKWGIFVVNLGLLIIYGYGIIRTMELL